MSGWLAGAGVVAIVAVLGVRELLRWRGGRWQGGMRSGSRQGED